MQIWADAAAPTTGNRAWSGEDLAAEHAQADWRGGNYRRVFMPMGEMTFSRAPAMGSGTTFSSRQRAANSL